jgi:hypothetical protein
MVVVVRAGVRLAYLVFLACVWLLGIKLSPIPGPSCVVVCGLLYVRTWKELVSLAWPDDGDVSGKYSLTNCVEDGYLYRIMKDDPAQD